MSDGPGISWTKATWNPVTGCDKVSEGCDHCYAETAAHRFDGTPAYPNGFAVTLRPERLHLDWVIAGDHVEVAGTVKAHELYRGHKQTRLVRPRRLDTPHPQEGEH